MSYSFFLHVRAITLANCSSNPIALGLSDMHLFYLHLAFGAFPLKQQPPRSAAPTPPAETPPAGAVLKFCSRNA